MDERELGRASPALWSVGALLLAAGDALAARFGALRVAGELSGFARAASGHCYFSLKDGAGGGAGQSSALLRCAMFRRAAGLLDFSPADGQQVEVRGELQLVVESLRRVGAGALYEAFLRLRDRLQAEGLFDASRKRSLPAFPQRLGLVTSTAAAALHDVLTALARRSPHVQVVIYPCLVQGAEAPASIAAAVQRANQCTASDGVEALLLVRGGGSLEDLWAFNDERVVRAVVASRLPVVCGVGHETDITLADLAADLRAPTPTAAAELAAPSRAALQEQLAHQAARMRMAWQVRVQRQAQQLDRLALQLAAPQAALAAQGQRLQHWHGRLQRAQRSHQQGQQLALLRLQGTLQALDPARVLQRGYAWVEDASGQPVLGSRQLTSGQALQGVWSDGRAALEVQALLPTIPG
jgi:exodeoxyribonuclease VII large subunit